MRDSLRNKILRYLESWEKLRPGRWTHKGEIEQKAKEIGYLAENATRRLRELENEGLIEHRLVNGSGEYRWFKKPLSITNFQHDGEIYQLLDYGEKL